MDRKRRRARRRTVGSGASHGDTPPDTWHGAAGSESRGKEAACPPGRSEPPPSPARLPARAGPPTTPPPSEGGGDGETPRARPPRVSPLRAQPRDARCCSVFGEHKLGFVPPRRHVTCLSQSEARRGGAAAAMVKPRPRTARAPPLAPRPSPQPRSPPMRRATTPRRVQPRRRQSETVAPVHSGWVSSSCLQQQRSAEPPRPAITAPPPA
ncbi:unnamed protein product [Lampetra fluviatilis]